MQEKTKKSKEKPCLESARAAYMVAWRDRYIARLEEELAGREEERKLLCALLYGALIKKGEGEDALTTRIDKAELTALLGRYSVTVENGEDAYTLRFAPTEKGSQHGASQES